LFFHSVSLTLLLVPKALADLLFVKNFLIATCMLHSSQYLIQPDLVHRVLQNVFLYKSNLVK
jgi:hypothetical protein